MSVSEGRGGVVPPRTTTNPSPHPPPYYPRHAPPPPPHYPGVEIHKVYPIIPQLSDEEWLRRGSREMLKAMRKGEVESNRIGVEHSRHMKELERRLQQAVMDIRNSKEGNKRLADDNQELRDLCCFLDDDRQKGRKLAREWQRFGRYTASVMRQEVQNYQAKLQDLDARQQQLVRDNLQLKELCVYLDEERVCRECGNTAVARDDGDGSSSSTNADESPTHSNTRATRTQNSILNEQILSYIRNLETRVQQLELEKSTSELAPIHRSYNGTQQRDDSSTTSLTGSDTSLSRPESIGRAMKVLEVQENMEVVGGGGGYNQETLGDRERALIREMCNVVWRKLEDAPVGS